MDTVSDPLSDPGRSRSPKLTLREASYRQIRKMALQGEFPFWQRIPEEGLAEILGVSRTPVREALARLDADGILRRYDDGGYYAAEPNIVDLRDLYEVRLTLELRGIYRAHEDGVVHDRVALEAMRQQWQSIADGAPPRADGSFIELDEMFHVGLLRSSGNVVLVELLESINVRIRTVRMHDFLDPERIALSTAEHLEILDALLAGQIDLAANLLKRHIGISLDVVEDRAARAMTAMMRLRRQRGHK